MRNRYNLMFLVRFALILLLATGILCVVALISYRSLDKMVGTIANEAKPNKRLILLKEIQYALSDAELNARTYSLTGEYAPIEQFYDNVEQSQEKLTELYNTQGGLRLQKFRIENIRSLVNQRIELMKDLIDIRSDSTQNTTDLQAIKDGLALLTKTNQRSKNINSNGEPEKKRSLFRRVFRKKEKEPDGSSVKNISDVNQRELQKLSKRIDEIALMQQQRKADMIKQELEIISQDKDVAQRIRGLIAKIERDEQKASLAMAAQAEDNAWFTTIMIVVLTVVTALVLMVAGVTVYSYVKANQRYRKVLSDSRHRAENLAKLRLEFLSNMSHEIRTPLNAIVGFSEQLDKQKLLPEQEKSVKIIRESSDHLSVLINDILDHAKMQSGMFNFEDISFKPREVVQQAVDFFSYQAMRKGIDLTLTFENDIPEYLGGDPLRLRQIMLNLISNALKFTPKGFVKLEALWLLPESNEQGVFQIVVTDSGIGIAPEKQKLIFEEYTQADSSTARKYGGTGLGLTITKKLIELQGGSVEIESELNKGTSFTVKIPYRLPTTKKSEENIVFSPTALEKLKTLRVLVADDENYNRLLLHQIFKKWGVVPEMAIDGLDVLEKISNGTYHLILMDVRMPYQDGIETTKKIREGFSPSHTNIPIIAVTAGVSADERNNCLASGMNDFITKPFRESQLIKILAQILSLETTGTIHETSHSNNGVNGIDLTELQKLTGNDDEFLKKMISGFIESSTSTLEELADFLRNEDYKGMELVSHRLAAPARHMGFIQMAGKLKEVERLAGEQGDIRELSQLIREIKQETDNVNKRLQAKLGELA
ncbi:MAG: ATP-binding protein [Flavobacteriales bacterium]